jgi:peptide/nickel transport system substrate-binding protein
VLVAVGAGLLVASSQGAGDQVRRGGTFRVALRLLDSVDPALAYSTQAWALLDTTCARLMNYPDKPPPAGFRLVPEVAAGPPRVSDNAKTFTFTLRAGFRFSDGTPVRASAFERAIYRTLAPGIRTLGEQYTRDIVGAGQVRAGRTTDVPGVVAQGRRLVVRLTRSTPDFPARTTMPFFCAVPPTLPADPEGVGAHPGSGPYYIAEYRPGQRVIMRRNRHYGGNRPHWVDGFLVQVGASSEQEVLDRIERDEADWGDVVFPTAFLDPERRLKAKYGLNRSQFFLTPGLAFAHFVLNTSRPLFRDNPRLRRAVNFAIDRRALRRVSGGPLASFLTDQYLPPQMPGFTNKALYPQTPDVRAAQRLAEGHTRSGKATLYTGNNAIQIAHAQILRRNLDAIGLDLEITTVPGATLGSRLRARDEAWDIGAPAWLPDYIDPYAYINLLLEARFSGGTNVGRFDAAEHDRLMRRAARLQGRARYRAYGDLDVELSRDAAPLVPVSYPNTFTLVSKRVGPRCIVLRPRLDLTVVCLKR